MKGNVTIGDWGSEIGDREGPFLSATRLGKGAYRWFVFFAHFPEYDYLVVQEGAASSRAESEQLASQMGAEKMPGWIGGVIMRLLRLQQRAQKPPTGESASFPVEYVYARGSGGWKRHAVVRKTKNCIFVSTDEVSEDGRGYRDPTLPCFRLDRATIELGECDRGRWYSKEGMEKERLREAMSREVQSDHYLPGAETPHGRMGLSLNATAREVRKQYRLLSRRLHPDAGGSHDEFVRLTTDYEAALRVATQIAAA